MIRRKLLQYFGAAAALLGISRIARADGSKFSIVVNGVSVGEATGVKFCIKPDGDLYECSAGSLYVTDVSNFRKIFTGHWMCPASQRRPFTLVGNRTIVSCWLGTTKGVSVGKRVIMDDVTFIAEEVV
jgi:hypothetical protein